MRVSEELRLAVAKARVSGLRQYHMALTIGCHPSTLSALLSGALPVQEGDERIVRLGAALGVPRERCFSDEDSLLYSPATHHITHTGA